MPMMGKLLVNGFRGLFLFFNSFIYIFHSFALFLYKIHFPEKSITSGFREVPSPIHLSFSLQYWSKAKRKKKRTLKADEISERFWYWVFGYVSCVVSFLLLLLPLNLFYYIKKTSTRRDKQRKIQKSNIVSFKNNSGGVFCKDIEVKKKIILKKIN